MYFMIFFFFLLFFKLSILPLYSDSNEVDQLTWREMHRIFNLFMPFFTCVWSPLDPTLLTDRRLLTAMNGLSTHQEQHLLLGQASPGSAILLSRVSRSIPPRLFIIVFFWWWPGFSNSKIASVTLSCKIRK